MANCELKKFLDLVLTDDPHRVDAVILGAPLGTWAQRITIIFHYAGLSAMMLESRSSGADVSTPTDEVSKGFTPSSDSKPFLVN